MTEPIVWAVLVSYWEDTGAVSVDTKRLHKPRSMSTDKAIVLTDMLVREIEATFDKT